MLFHMLCTRAAVAITSVATLCWSAVIKVETHGGNKADEDDSDDEERDDIHIYFDRNLLLILLERHKLS